MFLDAAELKLTENFSGVRMAEAPAEPAPEAPKEEEEPKVGELGDRTMTDTKIQAVPPCMDLSEFPLKEDYFEGRPQNMLHRGAFA